MYPAASRAAKQRKELGGWTDAAEAATKNASQAAAETRRHHRLGRRRAEGNMSRIDLRGAGEHRSTADAATAAARQHAQREVEFEEARFARA